MEAGRKYCSILEYWKYLETIVLLEYWNHGVTIVVLE
jgi:hypothetical protein